MNEMITFLEENSLLLIFICALTGYLTGSVSFARIVYFFMTKEKEIKFYSEPVAKSDETFDTNFVSASLINKRLGAKFGCITSIGDILKVAVPMLIAKLLFKTDPYYLIIPIFGMIGHYLPVYYNFVGGRGETIMLGSMFVVNWFGTLFVNVISTILGFLTGSVVVLRYAGYLLMILWLWHYYQDYRYAVFMLLMNLLFVFSMRKEISRVIELRKKGLLRMTGEELSESMFMGKGIGRAIDKYSLPVLFKKIKTRTGQK
jgi:acyl phosphate:glycerol-3-phosphate acyltransferase